ncbi:MAG: hypothetical protein ACMUIL_11835 [bacterium]
MVKTTRGERTTAPLLFYTLQVVYTLQLVQIRSPRDTVTLIGPLVDPGLDQRNLVSSEEITMCRAINGENAVDSGKMILHEIKNGL